MSTPEQSEEMDMSEIAKDKDSDSEVEHSDKMNISVSKDEKPPELEVKQSEKINMSEIANDEEPSESVLEQHEGNDFLQLEIQRDGIIQSNVKHWQQFKRIKPNLENDFSSIKSACKFLKLVLLGIRLVSF